MRCGHGAYFTEKTGYPASPKTIGEQIRKRRLDLGLRQIDVARIIGCDEMSVVNWEKGYRSPRVDHLGAVAEFLGFNPFRKGDTVAHRLVNHRKSLGLTQKAFASQLGVDPGTLAKWECGTRTPEGSFAAKVEAAIADRVANEMPRRPAECPDRVE